jgi:hypothetical protein
MITWRRCPSNPLIGEKSRTTQLEKVQKRYHLERLQSFPLLSSSAELSGAAQPLCLFVFRRNSRAIELTEVHMGMANSQLLHITALR